MTRYSFGWRSWIWVCISSNCERKSSTCTRLADSCWRGFGSVAISSLNGGGRGAWRNARAVAKEEPGAEFGD
eukprot:scaffold148969_cov27-Tisochrysis_lutea.AAC.5